MASTSDDSDESVWKGQLKSPIDPQVRSDPDKWRTKQHRVNKDPRKFEFAIVCKHCGVHRNSLGGMKIHLDHCPKRKRPDLLCGHCGLRVNDWPTMVRHLNRKDMEKQLPYDPKYKMDVRTVKLFPSDTPKFRHCALKVLGQESKKQKFKQRYNAWLDMHPTDIKSLRKEAANVRRGDPTATFPITPARYSTENSPCEVAGGDIVAQAVQIAQIGKSSREQSPDIQTQTVFSADDQGGGVVAFMDDAPPTFNISHPPLIALGSSLSDHSDVEPDDSTPQLNLALPASTPSVEIMPLSVISFTSLSAPLLLQPTASISCMSVASQSLVSTPVISTDILSLGEVVSSEPILQPMILSQPELEVDLNVLSRSISSQAHSGSMRIVTEDHDVDSRRLHANESLVPLSIPSSTHTPFQTILEGGEVSHAPLTNVIHESSSTNVLKDAIVTADADSSTDTDTPEISVPVPHNTVTVKTEPVDTITLSSSDGEDTVGISPISDVTALQRQVSELRRQRQRDLRQLVFWSDTVAKLGAEIDRPPTESECRARGKLISSGDWPSYMESVKTVSFRKLGSRFADFYRGSLHSFSTE